jgi:sulfatase maturation enzyme AslB (radical SAM superfamily)
MHPEFFKMLEFAQKWNKKFSINIHTNGSLRSKEDWEELAQILKGFQYEHRIRFSIDGLADTHNIYRQNTDYNKILENAKAFIDAGGIAVWQFIVFPWNEHQIDEARKVSKDLGFSRFDVRRDRSGVSKLSLEEIYQKKKNIKPANQDKIDVEKFLESYKDIENLPISCNNQDKGMYFISNDSRLWPCCFIPNGFYKSNRSHVAFLNERIYGNYGKDFNDLTKYTVDEILEHDFFMKDLSTSWDNSLSTGPCGKITRCAETCNLKTLDQKPISSRIRD